MPRLWANFELLLLAVQYLLSLNLPVIWFITDDVCSPPRIHLHIWCVCMCVFATKSQRDQWWLGIVIAGICFARANKSISRERGKSWGSVSGTLITIQSDTHARSLPLFLLNRELSWGPWSFIPGKLDPGEGLVGTDVRLQEAQEAPGVSMTLASVLFGTETWRDSKETQRYKWEGDERDVAAF